MATRSVGRLFNTTFPSFCLKPSSIPSSSFRAPSSSSSGAVADNFRTANWWATTHGGPQSISRPIQRICVFSGREEERMGCTWRMGERKKSCQQIDSNRNPCGGGCCQIPTHTKVLFFHPILHNHRLFHTNGLSPSTDSFYRAIITTTTMTTTTCNSSSLVASSGNFDGRPWREFGRPSSCYTTYRHLVSSPSKLSVSSGITTSTTSTTSSPALPSLSSSSPSSSFSEFSTISSSVLTSSPSSSSSSSSISSSSSSTFSSSISSSSSWAAPSLVAGLVLVSVLGCGALVLYAHPKGRKVMELLEEYNLAVTDYVSDRLDQYFPHSSEPLLPDFEKLELPENLPTLVIDLDKTIAHLEHDRRSGWRVVKRPGADRFFRELLNYYELVIWSDDNFPVAQEVMAKWGVPVIGCLHRDQCRKRSGSYIKDLSRLGRRLDRTIIIDHDAHACRFQPDNAIAIREFSGDPADRELDDLIDLLKTIAINPSDVRDQLKSYGGGDIDIGRRFVVQKYDNEKKSEARRSLSRAFGFGGTSVPAANGNGKWMKGV